MRLLQTYAHNLSANKLVPAFMGAAETLKFTLPINGSVS